MRAAPVLLTTAILVASPTIAVAGSDSPTPYTVTASGVTLPAGQTFREHGHVNYRATALDGTGERAFNVHLESGNERATATYIGTGFLDFVGATSAFPAGYCVTWVQVDGFDEHFGEGGQAPECTPAPTAPVPTPLSPAPGKPLTPAPGRPVAPAPVPETPKATEPDDAAPVEEPTSESGAETPTATPTTGELAATGPAPETPTGAATPVTQVVRPATEAAVTASTDEGGLAATGSNALIVAVGAGALVAAGVAAVLFSRRGRRA